jgi:hypothetical protein
VVGAVLAKQTDEWTEAHRYMGLDLLAKARTEITEWPTICHFGGRDLAQAFEVELPPEGVVDRLDQLPHRLEQGFCGLWVPRLR